MLTAEEARKLSAEGLKKMKQEEINEVISHIKSQCIFNGSEVQHSFTKHFPETIEFLENRGFKCERLDQNEWPSSTQYRISWGKKANHREAPTE